MRCSFAHVLLSTGVLLFISSRLPLCGATTRASDHVSFAVYTESIEGALRAANDSGLAYMGSAGSLHNVHHFRGPQQAAAVLAAHVDVTWHQQQVL